MYVDIFIISTDLLSLLPPCLSAILSPRHCRSAPGFTFPRLPPASVPLAAFLRVLMGKTAMLLPKGPHPPLHLPFMAFSVTPGIYRSTLFLNNLEPSLTVSFSLCHSVWSHALVSATSENSLNISHPSPATSPFVCFLSQNRFPERVAHGPCLTSSPFSPQSSFFPSTP